MLLAACTEKQLRCKQVGSRAGLWAVAPPKATRPELLLMNQPFLLSHQPAACSGGLGPLCAKLLLRLCFVG